MWKFFSEMVDHITYPSCKSYNFSRTRCLSLMKIIIEHIKIQIYIQEWLYIYNPTYPVIIFTVSAHTEQRGIKR